MIKFQGLNLCNICIPGIFIISILISCKNSNYNEKPVPGKYFMAHGASYAVIMQAHQPIKMGMPDFKELLIYPVSIPGWIMMAISFKGKHYRPHLHSC